MTKGFQIAVYEGGNLRVLGEGDRREAVLALPLSRLIVKMVRVPEEERDDPVAFSTPVIKALSPFPDEEPTVSCEVVRETEQGLVVLAAAMPEGAADDLGESLDAAGLNVTRVDSLALGLLRGLWPQLGVTSDGRRRLVLIEGADCLSAFALDDDQPSAVRAISAEADIARETMLVLLEAEDFGGVRELAEIVIVRMNDAEFAAKATETPEGETPPPAPSPARIDAVREERLKAFAPVRFVDSPGLEVAVEGVAERTLEGTAFDALPSSWREVLEETRFKRKLKRNLTIAGVIWALAVGVLFGVPAVYGYMTDHQKQLCKEHSNRYKEVKGIQEKVEIVRRYSDHSRGALEVLKAVSDRLPEGVELGNWNYDRSRGVSFKGVADEAKPVYEFKNNMAGIVFGAEGDENGEKLFPSVSLRGPQAGRNGQQSFSLECNFGEEEE